MATYISQPPSPSPPLALYGFLLVVSGVTLFSVFIYASIVSKLMPPSGIPAVDFLRNDRYYYLLIPCTLPVLVVAIYFHWLSMKFFKHS